MNISSYYTFYRMHKRQGRKLKSLQYISPNNFLSLKSSSITKQWKLLLNLKTVPMRTHVLKEMGFRESALRFTGLEEMYHNHWTSSNCGWVLIALNSASPIFFRVQGSQPLATAQERERPRLWS